MIDTAQQIGHGAAFQTASERLSIAYRAAGDFDRMRLHYRHAMDASPVRSISSIIWTGDWQRSGGT